ncbi:uncharacterized protein [Panulirus ornatus]|uniref:uncharacterized protein n=1 Tax=Panulirus ornatus TaxID=150431 RepID=UPI003A8A9C84
MTDAGGVVGVGVCVGVVGGKGGRGDVPQERRSAIGSRAQYGLVSRRGHTGPQGPTAHQQQPPKPRCPRVAATLTMGRVPPPLPAALLLLLLLLLSPAFAPWAAAEPDPKPKPQGAYYDTYDADQYEDYYDYSEVNDLGEGSTECVFEGQMYADGESFSPDDCTRCTCAGGEVTCEQTPCDENCAGVLCPEIECENQYIPLGQCCPVCPGR